MTPTEPTQRATALPGGTPPDVPTGARTSDGPASDLPAADRTVAHAAEAGGERPVVRLDGLPPSGSERRGRRRPKRRMDIASPAAQAVYRRVMETLRDGGVPFLVGGAYAFTPFTGIPRSTKDFDLFVAKVDIERALAVLAARGFEAELTFPHWLGKAYHGREFVDLIFSSGNGVAPVDAEWFRHAPRGEVLGVDVLLAPAEEMIWSKSFVMERERFDGGDVIHLLRARAEQLDWRRLIDRYGPFWRVLLTHLVLFGFVYPGERARVPVWVMRELLARLEPELAASDAEERLCNGTVISRAQFLPDVLEWGYVDGRLEPRGNMNADEIAAWTEAIGTKK